ncbi:uncharacterized protein LOC117109604 [Anneissia japonica]|uniref:uncharacterized protein LOC117109604 n=1 Tax=Anneissia japonica TaxID=1529436 RepID=UPI001425A7A7|nr:uncharacterized protein LOC117109604 [Anneissia japonica]
MLYYRELQKFAGPGIVFSASKPNTTHIASDDNIKISRRSRSLLRDSCKESSDYELVTTGINEISQRVALYENTWIYTSRCASVNSSCKGVIRVQSACKQKKGWAKAYARKIINGRPHGSYSWQWISVDRSCNCAISFN